MQQHRFPACHAKAESLLSFSIATLTMSLICWLLWLHLGKILGAKCTQTCDIAPEHSLLGSELVDIVGPAKQLCHLPASFFTSTRAGLYTQPSLAI